MSTQTQTKGKKKNKEVTKVSLEEFNQLDQIPIGHSVVSLKSLDWAETMADFDQQATETQQIIVPTAPRAQRGPGVDIDSLPNEPPFRVSLFNVPMSAEEHDIRERFFQGLDVLRVDLSSKTSTTVELGTRDSLYEALCKDGTSLRNRTVNVCLFGQTPPNNYQDRNSGRGGYGSYSDRNQGGGFGGSRMGPGSGYNRDRDMGFGRGGNSGFGQSRGGFGDGFQDRNSYRDNNRGSYTSGGGEPASDQAENWRAASRPVIKAPPPPASYNNGARQNYIHSRPEPSNYQHHHHQGPPHQQQYHESYPRYNQPHHNQSSNQMPDSQYNDRPGLNNRTINPSPSNEERPKLVIQKRTKPLDVDDLSSVKRNEAIFGHAKPSSKPYEKLQEIAKKLETVQVGDRRNSPQGGSSQSGSQPGSAPRSRQVSERS